MALTLLDYLFHREVQAMSNLSGQGKHGKKQLDPLMIYGIRCESSWVDITVDWPYKMLRFPQLLPKEQQSWRVAVAATHLNIKPSLC